MDLGALLAAWQAPSESTDPSRSGCPSSVRAFALAWLRNEGTPPGTVPVSPFERPRAHRAQIRRCEKSLGDGRRLGGGLDLSGV